MLKKNTQPSSPVKSPTLCLEAAGGSFEDQLINLLIKYIVRKKRNQLSLFMCSVFRESWCEGEAALWLTMKMFLFPVLWLVGQVEASYYQPIRNHDLTITSHLKKISQFFLNKAKFLSFFFGSELLNESHCLYVCLYVCMYVCMYVCRSHFFETLIFYNLYILQIYL